MNKIKIVIISLFLTSSLMFSQDVYNLRTDEPEVTNKQDTTKSDGSEIKQERQAVAILELDANGITKSEGKALTDRLSNEVFNVGIYEVMERDKVSQILNEMEFQLSGCTSNECAIEIGKLVGVNKMIAGSISKIGEFYTVSVRLMDVESGKIEATAIEDIKGSLGDVLTKAMPAIAQQISGVEKSEYVIEKEFSAINIITKPAAAEIFLNGNYKGVSPLQIKIEPEYKHRLTIKKSGYEEWTDSYLLNTNQKLNLNIALSKITQEKVVYKEPEKKVKAKYKNCFKIRYVANNKGVEKGLNQHIEAINQAISSNVLLFDADIPNSTSFSEIESFKGVEFYSTNEVTFIGFDFSIGLFRAEAFDWLKNLSKNEEKTGYSMVTWSPQVTFELKVAPIRYPLFYPYFNIGYSFNMLFMKAYDYAESIGGPSYASWGLVYGLGVEVRPFQALGISADWNRRSMIMQLMDIDDITDKFSDSGLDEVDLTGNNIGISLNFYF